MAIHHSQFTIHTKGNMNKIIQWFVENSVAANLAMMVILIGGGVAAFKLNKEAFPAANTGIIQITAPYPGAGPKEVEEQIIIRVEEAIGDLDGIDQISSTARLGSGNVQVEAVQGYDIQKLLNNIQTRIDAINTFPDDAERIQVREVQFRQQIMNLGVYGNVEEVALKQTAQHIRDELAALPNINSAELQAVRNDEMTIEVSEQTLRHYNLTFQQVVSAIRSSSLNLPAGTIKSSGGDVQLQTRGQAYYTEDFEEIVVDSNRDGVKLKLGDIATIKDDFEESEFIALLNNQPAVYINLYITDNPNVLKAREQVYAYLEDLHGKLPLGIQVKLWNDSTVMFEDRMNLLLKNAVSGLILVFVVLMLFLRPVLAS
jgi:multidrug efflux pump subunit AcrB